MGTFTYTRIEKAHTALPATKSRDKGLLGEPRGYEEN